MFAPFLSIPTQLATSSSSDGNVENIESKKYLVKSPTIDRSGKLCATPYNAI